MNKKITIVAGVIGLLASIIILANTFFIFFSIYMFAGMSGDPVGATIALMFAGFPVVVSFFLVWQFLRLVQSKKHINGFLLLIFLILIIIFIQIPSGVLGSYDSGSNMVVPRSILDYIRGV